MATVPLIHISPGIRRRLTITWNRIRGSLQYFRFRLWEHLFGHDVFISYARADALAYARELHARLNSKHFRCFVDEREFAIGEPLSVATRRHISISSMLVVVVTQHATTSSHVKAELEAFLSTGRLLIPINVDDALRRYGTESPWPKIQNLIWLNERIDSLARGPNDDTVRTLINSFSVTRRHTQRIRILGFAAVVFSALSILATVLASVSYIQWQRAEQRALLIEARRLATQAQIGIEQQPVESLILAAESAEIMNRSGQAPLPETQEALYRVLEKTGGLPIGPFSDRITRVSTSSNGEQVAVGDNSGSISVWPAHSMDEQHRTVLAGTGSVDGLTFLLDGSEMIAAFSDGHAGLWHAPFKNKPTAIFTCNGEGSGAMTVSPNGRWLALTTFSSRELCLFDLEAINAEQIVAHFGFEKGESATDIAFSNDSLYLLATSYASRRPLLVKLSDKPIALTLDHDLPEADGVISSPIENVFFCISDGNLFKVSPTPLGASLEEIPLPDGKAATDPLATSPDGRWLAVVMGNRTIQLLQVRAGGGVSSSTNLGDLPTGNIAGLQFDPTSELLFAGVGNALAKWSLDQAGPVGPPQLLFGHEAAVSAISVLPTGAVITGGRDRMVRVWERREEPQRIAGHEDLRNTFYSGYAMEWLNDGNTLVTSSRLTKQITLWAISPIVPPTASLVLPVTPHPIRSISFSRDERLMIAKPWDDIVATATPASALAWHVVDGLPSAEPIVIPASDEPIKSVAVDFDSSCIATTIDDGVRLQSLTNNGQPFIVSALGQTETVAFTAGDYLLVGALNELFVIRIDKCKPTASNVLPLPMVNLIVMARDGAWGALASGRKLFIWRTKDGSPVKLQEIGTHADFITSLAISPDGKLLASAGADKAVKIWDMTTNPPQSKATLLGHGQTVTHVDLSNDMAVTTSMDRTVRLWRLKQKGAEQVFLETSAGYFFSAEFSPGGDRVAVAGYDGTVRIWNTRVERLVERAAIFAGRNFSRCEWASLFTNEKYRRTFQEYTEPQSENGPCN